MDKVQRLKRSALESAESRGHNMSRFQRDIYWKNVHTSTCNTCGKQVSVDPKPLPNGIEIGGEAVALDCED